MSDGGQCSSAFDDPEHGIHVYARLPSKLTKGRQRAALLSVYVYEPAPLEFPKCAFNRIDGHRLQPVPPLTEDAEALRDECNDIGRGQTSSEPSGAPPRERVRPGIVDRRGSPGTVTRCLQESGVRTNARSDPPRWY